ncbi:MAG: hypothetical protein ACHRXM_35505 [Isosphaerales bacterium]
MIRNSGMTESARKVPGAGTLADLDQHPERGLGPGLFHGRRFMVGAITRGHIGDEFPAGERRCVPVHNGPGIECRLYLLEYVVPCPEHAGDVRR